MLAQGEVKEAIQALDLANKSAESLDAYRNLSLAYYLNGDFEQSVDALNRAHSLNASVIGDRDAMVAGIRSYTELGKFDIAKTLLSLLLKDKPEMIDDEEYLNTVQFLRAKMLDAGYESE